MNLTHLLKGASHKRAIYEIEVQANRPVMIEIRTVIDSRAAEGKGIHGRTF